MQRWPLLAELGDTAAVETSPVAQPTRQRIRGTEVTALSLRGLRGGVGTSSVLAAVGYALHRLGERVLMIDMCPENLLRLHFNLATAEKRGWARGMLDGEDWYDQAWSLAPI